jgi:ribonuclease HII
VLTAAERNELSVAIRASAHWSIGWASHEEIDRINIYQARKLCVMRALQGLTVWPGAVISDALKLPMPGVRPIVKADALSVSVAAASVIAKVARDAVMVEMCDRYHGYGFCRHKGYATPEHKRQLALRGPCDIHRKTWAPVAQASLPW